MLLDSTEDPVLIAVPKAIIELLLVAGTVGAVSRSSHQSDSSPGVLQERQHPYYSGVASAYLYHGNATRCGKPSSLRSIPRLLGSQHDKLRPYPYGIVYVSV